MMEGEPLFMAIGVTLWVTALLVGIWAYHNQRLEREALAEIAAELGGQPPSGDGFVAGMFRGRDRPQVGLPVATDPRRPAPL
jgi:hypothetical protein